MDGLFFAGWLLCLLYLWLEFILLERQGKRAQSGGVGEFLLRGQLFLGGNAYNADVSQDFLDFFISLAYQFLGFFADHQPC